MGGLTDYTTGREISALAQPNVPGNANHSISDVVTSESTFLHAPAIALSLLDSQNHITEQSSRCAVGDSSSFCFSSLSSSLMAAGSAGRNTKPGGGSPTGTRKSAFREGI